jgi:hypothetical protein
MPSPHPDHQPSPDGPKPRQLRYLRALANNRGQTFTYPRTKAQASAEIRRLEALPRQDWRDQAAEREQLASTRIPEDAARAYPHLTRLRAQVAFASNRGRDAPPPLAREVRRSHPQAKASSALVRPAC